MDDELIRILSDLDFTDYEAKTYLALLRESPSTGYAVARSSGVPRSKIYEVLESLVTRGDVLLSKGDQTLYSPRSPSELVRMRRERLEGRLDTAAVALDAYARSREPDDLIWDIRGSEEIFFRIREVVGRARSQLLVQIWGSDAHELREALRGAAERGVAIDIVAYGDPDMPFAMVRLHEPGAREIEDEYGGRWAILSRDGEEIVAGIVSKGADSRAAWSSHLGIVMPITEQIKHDLYIAEMLRDHRAVLEASYGPALAELRGRFGPPSTVYRPKEGS
jgi:HTH-type transcriptional regulator, sugar sensing transcriptional regulator